jgi:hypothetical protein
MPTDPALDPLIQGNAGLRTSARLARLEQEDRQQSPAGQYGKWTGTFGAGTPGHGFWVDVGDGNAILEVWASSGLESSGAGQEATAVLYVGGAATVTLLRVFSSSSAIVTGVATSPVISGISGITAGVSGALSSMVVVRPPIGASGLAFVELRYVGAGAIITNPELFVARRP